MIEDVKPDVADPPEQQAVEVKPPRSANRSPALQSATRILRFALLALVLVLVALVSALTAMRIAIHGRQVQVPQLLGLTPHEAESLLVDNGLRLEIENRFYSADVPAGRLVSQSPLGGTEVRRGWRVRVAESLGAPRAKVPNVIGQSSRAAEINLRRRGLEPGKIGVVHLPGLPINQVVGTSPPPETVGSSPRVALLITGSEESKAMLMPNLVGQSLIDAEKLLKKAGLQPPKTKALSASTRVAKQLPAPGSKVTSETKIGLVAR